MRGYGRLGMLAVVLFAAVAPVNARAQDSAGPHPWTDKPILESSDRFQFVIIADITGGRREGVFEQVTEKLNMLQPAFVMSVGDLIEGYSDEKVAVRAEREALHAELDTLDMRFYMVAGNHDLSNPAMVDQWADQYGPSWYHFVYRDVLFLCLNTEDPPDTHIGRQQSEWARRVLNENADVRWTFVFMHKPLWLYEENAALHGWAPIAEALKERPHTVFGGHWHRYVQSVRDGSEHYVLATSGGVSNMRGPALGELDHVVWVTMTDTGPAIANLEISGIIGPDMVTEEISKVNGFLVDGAYAQTSGVASNGQMFAEGNTTVRLTNGQPVSIAIVGRFEEHDLLTAEPAEFTVGLAPGESRDVAVTVRAAEPTELSEIAPMLLSFHATWQPEGREPITVSASRQIDVHGAHEGPNLVTNGRFDDTARPWFAWAHSPQVGTVGFGDGEMRAVLDEPEFPWSAGMGQYVRAMRPAGRYRLSFRSQNAGEPGVVHCQIGIDGREAPLWLTVDGQRVQAAQVEVGPEMALHTVEFVLPEDADLSAAKLILLLGELRDARVDDVSLRQVVGEPAPVQ